MASNGYPKVPLKAWRQIPHAKAQSAPTTKFTPEVVAAQAGMASPDSAATNIVGPLRRLGLIDKDGGLTLSRGNKSATSTPRTLRLARRSSTRSSPTALAALTQ